MRQAVLFSVVVTEVRNIREQRLNELELAVGTYIDGLVRILPDSRPRYLCLLRLTQRTTYLAVCLRAAARFL